MATVRVREEVVLRMSTAEAQHLLRFLDYYGGRGRGPVGTALHEALSR